MSSNSTVMFVSVGEKVRVQLGDWTKMRRISLTQKYIESHMVLLPSFYTSLLRPACTQNLSNKSPDVHSLSIEAGMSEEEDVASRDHERWIAAPDEGVEWREIGGEI